VPVEKSPSQGINFTNVLRELLRVQIPKVQKDSKVFSLFVHLGSAPVKAAGKTLMKLTPDFLVQQSST
jgi:hypothetical protein